MGVTPEGFPFMKIRAPGGWLAISMLCLDPENMEAHPVAINKISGSGTKINLVKIGFRALWKLLVGNVFASSSFEKDSTIRI